MKKIFLFLLAAIIMNSCSMSDLKETQFVEDPEYPGLPIYSDMGYNTFGAYINDHTFYISPYNNDRPFYLVVDREGLNLSLYGYYQNTPLTMAFEIPLDADFKMEDYHDLLSLDGNSFVIDTISTTCRVKMEGDNAPSFVSIYSGHFTFENIRQVIADKEDTEVIVAGKFQFRAVRPDGGYIDVAGGRFDLGVNETNFVNFRR